MRLTVRGRESDYEVDAWPTPIPGLAIAADTTGTFTVTHVRSGLALVGSVSPENAMRLAVEFAGDVDWTLSAAELRDSEPAREAKRAMARKADLSLPGEAPIDAYDLNAVA